MKIPPLSESLRAYFAGDGVLPLPKLISKVDARLLAGAVRELPAKRVTVGGSGPCWDEQQIGDESELVRLFTSEEIFRLLECVVGLSKVSNFRLKCWISRYREGEYIPQHNDAAGTVHIILCLERRHVSGGGELFIKSPGGTYRLMLESGDAVLFDAARLKHWTTPLAPCNTVRARPTRVVAVARIFI